MAISTIYDVRVRLMMTDKGSKALLGTLRKLRNLKVEMAGIRRESSGIGLGLGRLAGIAGGAFGLYKAKDALIDFNSNLEQGRITMAGMMSQATGQAFGDSMRDATDLVGKLQMRARDSIGTTEDMVNMASMITRPITAAGLGMKDLEDFTANAVVAAKAFNIAPDMAARDIEAALMGQLKSVDRFSRALLESHAFGGKFVGESGRQAFNAMSAPERASTYRQALTSGGIADLAKAQGKTFSGVLSTLQDNLQMALGKIGLPLFQAITNEIKSWNTWIDANGPAIQEFSQSLSQTLVKAFKTAKDAAAFLTRHKDLLMALAKAWLAGNAVKMMTSGIVDAVSAVKALTDGAGGGLAGLAKSASGAAMALGVVAGAAVAFASWVDSEHEKSIDEGVKRASFGDLIKQTIAGQRSPKFLYDEAKRMGYVNKDGTMSERSPLRSTGTTRDDVKYIIGETDDAYTIGMGKQINELLRQGMFDRNAELLASKQVPFYQMPPIPDANGGTGGKTARDKDINVNIRNVEVATDDVDRFVLGMAALAEDSIRNPSAARGSIRY